MRPTLSYQPDIEIWKYNPTMRVIYFFCRNRSLLSDLKDFGRLTQDISGNDNLYSLRVSMSYQFSEVVNYIHSL